MGTAYQTGDAKDSRKLAEFLAKEGQLPLPLLEMVEQSEAAGVPVERRADRAVVGGGVVGGGEGVPPDHGL